MILLFVIFGWGKLTNFSGTMAYFASDNLPMPALATLIAVVMEFFVGLALLLGRPDPSAGAHSEQSTRWRPG